MTSLSTRFLGQPRLTKPTLVGAGEARAKFGLAEMISFLGTGNKQRETGN